MGTHVTSTMQKGILVASVFRANDSCSSPASSPPSLPPAPGCRWLLSTVGPSLRRIVLSEPWSASGLFMEASALFSGVPWRELLLRGSSLLSWEQLFHSLFTNAYAGAPNPGQAAAAAAPIAVFLGVTGISFSAFPLSKIFPIALAQALACGTAGAVIVSRVIHKQLDTSYPPKQRNLHRQRNRMFRASDFYPTSRARQEPSWRSCTASSVTCKCCRLASCRSRTGERCVERHRPSGGRTIHPAWRRERAEIVIPTDVLAWGGFGIVAGLMMWAEFAAASVVLVASKLGLPISATHTLVGAVMGVGFARGLNSVRAETVREIVASWVVTIPVGALLSVIYTWILTKILPSFV
uniref:Phosphate transporter n=1 Tax=Ananas comosus var. bracteatus TaxID=296719 RepID=A0A6V7NNA4_ANACO|nr:unnamed protein product [Ananas comosus var. bracteatus]